jgi:hypothetical protein
MTFLLGVILGGLAMWRWQGAIREGVSKAVEQLAKGKPAAAPGVEFGAGERADSAPHLPSKPEGAERNDTRHTAEDVGSPLRGRLSGVSIDVQS